MNNKKWEDLNIKEKLGIGTAVLSFTIGWTLTICAAFVSLLLSEQGILWILGQSLIYTASVLGLSYYFKGETVQMRRDVERYFNKKERLQLERMKIRQGVDEGEIPDDGESEE